MIDMWLSCSENNMQNPKNFILSKIDELEIIRIMIETLIIGANHTQNIS